MRIRGVVWQALQPVLGWTNSYAQWTCWNSSPWWICFRSLLIVWPSRDGGFKEDRQMEYALNNRRVGNNGTRKKDGRVMRIHIAIQEEY